MISDFTVLATKSEPCVSLSYLSMVRFAAQNSDRWNMRYPNKASFDKINVELGLEYDQYEYETDRDKGNFSFPFSLHFLQ